MRKFWSLLWFFVIVAIVVSNGDVASDAGMTDVMGGTAEMGEDLTLEDGGAVDGYEDDDGLEASELDGALNEGPGEDANTFDEVTYRVSNIVDGDTIDVIINGEQKRIRLIGVDTPEVYGGVDCFGREASSATADKLLGELVLLEADESQGDLDRYDRLLRFVFLADGTNFGEWLIEQGFATEYTYRKDYKYKADYVAAEARARESGAGMWAEDACPIGEY